MAKSAGTSKEKTQPEKKGVEPGSEIADLAGLIANMTKVMTHLQSVAGASNTSIHVTDWLLLHSLAEENNQPMAQLARKIGVSRQRVHQQVESLKAAEFISIADVEGKFKAIALTAAGRQLVQSMDKEMINALKGDGAVPTTQLRNAKRTMVLLARSILPKPAAKAA